MAYAQRQTVSRYHFGAYTPTRPLLWGKGFAKCTIIMKPQKIVEASRLVFKWVGRKSLPCEFLPRKGRAVLQLTRIAKVRLYSGHKLTDGTRLRFPNPTRTSKPKRGKQILK